MPDEKTPNTKTAIKPYHHPAGSPQGGQFASTEFAQGAGKERVMSVPYRGTRVEQRVGFTRNLPELVGTDKQREWAGQIREGVLGTMRAGTEQSRELARHHDPETQKRLEGKALATQKLHNDLAKETDANFWIDNQKTLGKDVRPHTTGSAEHSENIQNIRRTLDEHRSQRDAGAKLPELTGSEKQVAWAQKIRDQAIAYTKKRFKPEMLDGTVQPMNEKQKQILDATRDAWKKLQDEQSAKWWIDNKDTAKDHVEGAARRKAKEIGLI
jgi:hypothetical protein